MLPYHTRPACPAEYVPLLYISFLMVIFGVCIHFSKIFSNAEVHVGFLHVQS